MCGTCGMRETPEPDQPGPQTSPPDIIAGKKFLVVDDEPAILKTVSRLVTTLGGQVDTADNAEMALARLALLDFDVVISDVRMGRNSGLRLLSTANTWGFAPGAKWVMVSGSWTAGELSLAETFGAVTLDKPAGKGKLLDTIRTLLAPPAPAAAPEIAAETVAAEGPATVASTAPPATPPAATPIKDLVCSFCGHAYRPEDPSCPHCGGA